MIQINDLRKQYKDEIVLDIPDLSIVEGECVGLVGNNGAGKTTLFRLILDMIHPTSGQVRINGSDVRNHEEWKKFVGAYLDEHMLLDYLTADEYFRFLGKVYGMNEKDVTQYLSTYQELFNGEIQSNPKYIRDLSKGNIKKVGIASAMMGSKHIVLLDEPFENLDPSSQSRLKNIILKKKAEKEKYIFFISSHDLTHVTDVCERIILLEKGEMKQDLRAEKKEMITALNAYFEV